MIFKNNHQEKVLNHLAAILKKVAGDEFDYEDLDVGLAILDRALADTLEIKPDFVGLIDAHLIDNLDVEMQAYMGRGLAMRASLLLDMGKESEATAMALLSIRAYRHSLSVRFDNEDEEGRYVAHYLHQLLRHPVAALAFSPHDVAHSYRTLFAFYADQGLLDRAEDMLFHALDLLSSPPELLREGIEFYDALLDEDPRELKRRGLPLREVQAARDELRERLANT